MALMPIIYILSLIPLAIWAFMEPLALRFADLNSITTSLGQILGLVGMTLFSINLILAGRFKFVDKYFKGLDKVYAKHHLIGSVAFSMLLFHPILLVVKYVVVSVRDAALFFVPFNNMPVTWGIISLFVMIVLIVATFYIKLKYHKWKMSHKFMTLAFVFAVLHMFFIASDVSRSNLLRYYILAIALLGLVSVSRKAIFEIFGLNKYKYQIRKINLLNNETVEIEMEPEKRKMNFVPGQFAFFRFFGEGVSSESHPFSMASSVLENNLKIITKNFGDYTSQLKSLKVGDRALVDGPYGGFSYKKAENKNQIWIAGGIGITPFLSMSQTLESDYIVDMYYSVKENGEAVNIKDLQNISEKNPKFKYNLWITKEKGYITGEIIKNLSHGLESKDIFLCGPPVFMKSLKDQFVSLGVDIKKIHYENFSF
jgi:predicted ferric reductase